MLVGLVTITCWFIPNSLSVEGISALSLLAALPVSHPVLRLSAAYDPGPAVWRIRHAEGWLVRVPWRVVERVRVFAMLRVGG